MQYYKRNVAIINLLNTAKFSTVLLFNSYRTCHRKEENQAEEFYQLI